MGLGAVNREVEQDEHGVVVEIGVGRSPGISCGCRRAPSQRTGRRTLRASLGCRVRQLFCPSGKGDKEGLRMRRTTSVTIGRPEGQRVFRPIGRCGCAPQAYRSRWPRSGQTKGRPPQGECGGRPGEGPSRRTLGGGCARAAQVAVGRGAAAAHLAIIQRGPASTGVCAPLAAPRLPIGRPSCNDQGRCERCGTSK